MIFFAIFFALLLRRFRVNCFLGSLWRLVNNVTQQRALTANKIFISRICREIFTFPHPPPPRATVLTCHRPNDTTCCELSIHAHKSWHCKEIQSNTSPYFFQRPVDCGKVIKTFLVFSPRPHFFPASNDVKWTPLTCDIKRAANPVMCMFLCVEN